MATKYKEICSFNVKTIQGVCKTFARLNYKCHWTHFSNLRISWFSPNLPSDLNSVSGWQCYLLNLKPPNSLLYFDGTGTAGNNLLFWVVVGQEGSSVALGQILLLFHWQGRPNGHLLHRCTKGRKKKISTYNLKFCAYIHYFNFKTLWEIK